MLYFCFSIQIEPLDMIELWSNLIPAVLVGHVTKCHESRHLVRCSIMTHDWIPWLDLINPIPWFNLICSIIWFGLITSSIWFFLIKSFIWFIESLWLNWYFLQLPVECGERRSPSHSREYHWLWPDLTHNTRGRHIPIFPLVLVSLTPDVLAWRFSPNLT